VTNVVEEIDGLADFYVLPYSMTERWHSAMMAMTRDIIVVDESQYLKNPEAKRTQAFLGHTCDGSDALYETCDQMTMLSGTPIERYADDMWAQLRATHPDELQAHGALYLPQFQKTFCFMEDKTYANGAVTKRVSTANTNTRQLNRLIYQDVGAIRRTMEEVNPHMPPVKASLISIVMQDNSALMQMLAALPKDEATLDNLMDTEHYTTLRRLTGLAKVQNATRYIADTFSGTPTLVGFWHKEVGKEMLKKLTGYGLRAAMIDGSMVGPKRDLVKEQFMYGGLDILLGQMQSMGVALDGLQSVCRRVIIAEDEFAPSKVEQFYKRVWRLGQEEPVSVEFLRAMDNPIDDSVARIRERKDVGARKVLTKVAQ
jgi:SWI/SNF-related matrix-associated actin-dependent regulator 1 of chromatin subfamily A